MGLHGGREKLYTVRLNTVIIKLRLLPYITIIRGYMLDLKRPDPSQTPHGHTFRVVIVGVISRPRGATEQWVLILVTFHATLRGFCV